MYDGSRIRSYPAAFTLVTWDAQKGQHERFRNDLRELAAEAGSFGAGRRTGDLGWSFLNWLFGVDPTLPLDRVYYRGLVPGEVKVLPYTSSDHSALLVPFALPD